VMEDLEGYQPIVLDVARSAGCSPWPEWLSRRSCWSPGRWYAPRVYTALGDTGRAIAMIQSAFEQRSGDILSLPCETAYPALRNKPQIREIVRRIGVPE
jgi:hypothetical protein